MPAGLTYVFAKKECPTKFETRWLQEIPFSKELTDNYCALRLLYESIMQTQTQTHHLNVQFSKINHGLEGYLSIALAGQLDTIWKSYLDSC